MFMGKGGFTLLESGSHVNLLANTNLLSKDVSLSDPLVADSWPENLMTFIHLSLSLPELIKVNVLRNTTNPTTTFAFALNNNEQLIGDVFRSIPIIRGENINFQLQSGSSGTIKYKIGLEG